MMIIKVYLSRVKDMGLRVEIGDIGLGDREYRVRG
jgi:hypothetical protein